MSTILDVDNATKTTLKVAEMPAITHAQWEQVGQQPKRLDRAIWTPQVKTVAEQLTNWNSDLRSRTRAIEQMSSRFTEISRLVGETVLAASEKMRPVAASIAETSLRVGQAVVPIVELAASLESRLAPLQRIANPQIIIPSAFTEAMQAAARFSQWFERLARQWPDQRTWDLLLLRMAQNALEDNDTANVDLFLSHWLGIKRPTEDHRYALWVELRRPGPRRAEKPVSYLRRAVRLNVTRDRNEQEEWERLFWDEGPGGGGVVPLDQSVSEERPGVLLVDQVAYVPPPDISGEFIEAVMAMLSPNERRIVRRVVFSGYGIREAVGLVYPDRNPKQRDNTWNNIKRRILRRFPDLRALLT